MKFRREPEQSPDINLTPLIDVVFLLLIFFMVSTTFDTTSELKINLPEASSEVPVEKSAPLDLSIDAAGHFYLNGNEVKGQGRGQLLQSLIKVVGDERNRPVVVRADSRAPVQSMVTAMDALAQMDMARISIATQHNGE